MKHSKRTIVATLAAALSLSLLLTACSNGGDASAGDNTTPGASSTSSSENHTTPGTSSASAEMPDESNPPDTSTPPKLEKPPKLDIPYGDDEASKEAKDQIDHHIDLFNERAGIDVDSLIEETYKNYGQYMNENINEDAIRVGIACSAGSMYMSKSNVTGISPDALKKMNDFLESEGEEQLDITKPEQNLTAFLIAASLFYDPDITNGDPGYDIAMAFGTARADSSVSGHAEREADSFWSAYVSLFGGPFVLEEALK